MSEQEHPGMTSQSAQKVEAPQPEVLVRNNIGWMLSVARRLLGDHGLAEDVVQEALLAALNGLDKFEHRSSLKTWLHRITVNTALMKLRQLKRRPEQALDELQPEFDRYNCRIENRWDHLTSVEDILLNEELRTHVHSMIDELPDNYRIVLLLRDIEGFSTAEVAKLLVISEPNVKVRLHRARAALKILLEPMIRGEQLT